MRRLKIDNTQETLILMGLIVSTNFIKDVKSILDVRLFDSDHAKIIARWCLKFFDENGEAPNIHIQDIFEKESDNLDDHETDMIANVLDRVSKEYDRTDKLNHGYLLKVAERFFSSVHIKKECRDILQLVEKNPQEAALRMDEFKSLEIPDVEGFSPFNDKKLMKEAFEQRTKPIFKMPGALGKMINSDLTRESFIGILGAEKTGKTWTLLEFAIQATRQRCNVAFFQAGDMTDLQQTARIGIRITGKSDKSKYCKTILIPMYDCIHNQNDSCDKRKRTCQIGLGFGNTQERDRLIGVNNIEKMSFFKEMTEEGYTACTYCRNKSYDYKGAVWYKIRPEVNPLTWKEAYNAVQHFYKVRMRGKDFKLHSSSGDLTIDKVDRILDHWERTDNFVPDVVITDYADLFVNTATDFRHGTNEIWKQHRFLAQRRNCLVITATQADAEAYGKKKLELSNFSEDKRKYAHVTAFYALSQTYAEKVIGVMRMSHLVVRDDAFDPRTEVKILRSIEIGKPLLGSFF